MFALFFSRQLTIKCRYFNLKICILRLIESWYFPFNICVNAFEVELRQRLARHLKNYILEQEFQLKSKFISIITSWTRGFCYFLLCPFSRRDISFNVRHPERITYKRFCDALLWYTIFKFKFKEKRTCSQIKYLQKMTIIS